MPFLFPGNQRLRNLSGPQWSLFTSHLELYVPVKMLSPLVECRKENMIMDIQVWMGVGNIEPLAPDKEQDSWVYGIPPHPNKAKQPERSLIREHPLFTLQVFQGGRLAAAVPVCSTPQCLLVFLRADTKLWIKSK